MGSKKLSVQIKISSAKWKKFKAETGMKDPSIVVEQLIDLFTKSVRATRRKTLSRDR